MAASVDAQSLERITPGQEWPDRKGEHINAHGGGLLFHEGKYYWYGENRPARGFTTEVGVEVYSSSDLMNWEDEGVALAVSEEAGHDIGFDATLLDWVMKYRSDWKRERKANIVEQR